MSYFIFLEFFSNTIRNSYWRIVFFVTCNTHVIYNIPRHC